ncbi:Metabotropic glutamate receptor-like protein [Seminavis robusta]|uniref:Metabotropic glutamate receptor-like protein n=1 Tax=Seminavis robusta TaxID=568900 RepID=A0A9N8HG92_9STRA|nr:Metabotropic glutamate receptor-like protein [Seminavis robusta]|eukprot:Sro620_g176580.1 Metabotropic glutamate receptor-like protein (929) ;mRNA; r:16179-19325
MVHAFGQVNASSHTTAGAQGTASTTSHKVEQRPQCWVPVILYYHTDTASDWFAYFVEEMLEAPNRPAVILDAGGNEVDDYSTPVRLNSTAHEKRDVWLHSYITNSETYWQHQITINTTAQPPVVTNVSAVFVESIADLPEEYKKDTLYQNQIRLLRQFANEAIEHDVVVGTALAMPTQRVGPYIRCLGGECEAGNLFANAMQWEAQTDIAFLASGGLRGNGWEAGPVHLSEIWGMLPFPNTICTGTMSGVSLFNILEYSIRTATFEKHQSDQAARLLQVAGLKITYNNKLPYGSSRLLAVDVWNQKQGKWKSLSPTRLYTFASSSYECGEYQPYPMLTGTDGSFSIQGEMGGTIGEKLVQDAVRDYLENLSQPYNTTLEGRITGVASEEAILDFLELEEDCGASEFYSMNHRLCMPCPDARHVAFSDELVQFKYQLGRAISLEAVDNELRAMSENDNTTSVPNADQDDSGLVARILLVNRELSNFTVIPKLIPSWLQMVPVSENGVSIQGVIIAEGQNYLLESGARLALNLIATPSKVTGMVGTVVGTVAVRVLADDAINTDPGMTRCDEFGEDVTFDAALTILPQEELNHLGDIRFMGLALMAIVMATSVGFALFVFVYRETRILKTMQPVFLMAICLGIFIMSSTILPLSFDDGIISPEQCSQMCISQPWLFSIGCTILFSVLFSKLWRINRLLHAPRFERLMVTEKDVMGPFLVLFTANVALLLTWTLVDPLQWTRRPVEDEPWKTYGSCSSNGIGYVFMGLIGLLLLTALLMACYQAYKARDISDEFSEGKNLGLALFTWIQVMLLGGPTLFLVDQENFTARFFIEVGLIAALGASMLLFIFVPLVKGVMELKKQPPGGTNHQSNHISGDRQQSMAVSGFPTSFESTNGVGAVSSRAAINPVRVRNMSASMREDIDTTEDPMHP